MNQNKFRVRPQSVSIVADFNVRTTDHQPLSKCIPVNVEVGSFSVEPDDFQVQLLVRLHNLVATYLFLNLVNLRPLHVEFTYFISTVLGCSPPRMADKTLWTRVGNARTVILDELVGD